MCELQELRMIEIKLDNITTYMMKRQINYYKIFLVDNVAPGYWKENICLFDVCIL